MRAKVIDAVRRIGLETQVRTLDRPTRTVPEAAAALGCEPGRIAKSIVFLADGEPVVCVASGSHQVDPDRLCEVLDCVTAKVASAEEVRAATGFAPGGVPPVGHGLPVVLDATLLECETVFASGGDGSSLFEVDPRALAERLGARIAALAHR